RGNGGASALDVALEVLDCVTLVLDHALDEVADRDYAGHGAVPHHRQVADAPLGHQAHRVIDGLVRFGGDHGGTHDLAHRGAGGGAALQHHLAGVVALGNDADELPVLDHQQRADVPFGHQPDRIEHRCIGRNGINVA